MKQVVLAQKPRRLPIYKVKGRSTTSRVLVVNADTHVGSRFAVCSKEMPDKETKWQSVFREHWLECSDKIGKHDLHLGNGDIINGTNRKNNGAENWTSDIVAQIYDAVKAFREWRFRNILVTQGSGYHVSDGGWSWYEEIFAKEIGAVKNGEEGRYTDDETVFEINGRIFNACHHVAGSKWPAYITTPLAREALGTSINRPKYYDEREVKHIDVMIRSHRHVRNISDVGNTISVATACWQARNKFMRKTGMGSVFPNFGCIWFIIEQNGAITYEKNEIPDWKLPKKELLHF